MSNIMDYIKSGKGLPPLEDNIPPMPEVKPPREKINFRQYYKLDESDLKKILSEYFGTNINKVFIKIVPVSVGYGKAEHEECHVEVTVEKWTINKEYNVR